MSRPGDPGRRLEWVEGPAEQIVVKAVELIRETQAKTFSLRYDARDRQLAEDEEPDPGEAVVWTASAEYVDRTLRHKVKRTVTGTALVDPATRTPPGGHAQGIVLAVVELLEKLGANVVAMFPEYQTPPTEGAPPP